MSLDAIVNTQAPLCYFGFYSVNEKNKKTQNENRVLTGLHIAGYIPIVSIASGVFVCLAGAYGVYKNPKSLFSLPCITVIGRSILEILGQRWLLMGADAVVTLLRIGVAYTRPSAVSLPRLIQVTELTKILVQWNSAPCAVRNEHQHQCILTIGDTEWSHSLTDRQIRGLIKHSKQVLLEGMAEELKVSSLSSERESTLEETQTLLRQIISPQVV